MKTLLIILLLLVPSFCYSQGLSIEEKKDFSSGKDFVVNAEFSPFRNFFAIARRNNILEIYDRNWNLVFEHQGNKSSYAGIIAFSPDETMMAYGRYKGDNDIVIIDNDGYVCIYEYRKDEYQPIQKVKTHYSYTYSLDYNPVKHEFMAGASGSLIKFSLDNNRFIRSDSIKESIDPRNGIEYSPDGNYAFIPHYSRLMIFRNNEKSLEEIDGIYRHSETVLGSSFSDDGQFLASWSVDSSLIIWNVSPLIPSKKTLISSWVNDNLTTAQRKVLTHNFVSEIYNKIE